MAVNVNVYDLELYPDNNKTVTIDIKQVTPIGYEGDEQWVVSATTSAYSKDFIDNNETTRLAISDIYVLNQRAGWAKSSGLINKSKFNFTGSNNTLSIKIDGDSSWRSVVLTTGSGYSADTVAEMIEDGIRALAAPGGAIAGGTDSHMGYLNASVEYEDGKFKIVSGSVSNSYANTSVEVKYDSSAATYLGFDKGINSYLLNLEKYEPKETTLASAYTAGGMYITLTDEMGISDNPAFCISKNDAQDPSYEYFVIVSGTHPNYYVRSAAGDELANSYSEDDKVQRLRYQDPDAVPTPWYQDIDSIVRWGIKSLANQIDFEQ